MSQRCNDGIGEKRWKVAQDGPGGSSHGGARTVIPTHCE